MNRRIRLLTGVLTSVLILLSSEIQADCGTAKETEATLPKTESTAPGSGSSAKEETKAGSENLLAETEWRLVEIQSMDDTIGTVRPEDPSLLTIRLNIDGTVNMRLDCNRANGTGFA